MNAMQRLLIIRTECLIMLDFVIKNENAESVKIAVAQCMDEFYSHSEENKNT